MRHRSALLHNLIALVVLIAALIAFGCGDDDNGTSSPTTPVESEWWQYLSLPTESAWWSVYGFSATEIFVAGEQGLVFRGDGTSWTDLNASSTSEAPDRVFYSLWGRASNDLYVVGADYNDALDTIGYDTVWDEDVGDSVVVPITIAANDPHIEHYNGTVFSELPDQVTFNEALFGVWGGSDGRVVMVGNRGRIATYDGGPWEVLTGDGDVRLLSVWGASDTVMFAVGVLGTIVRYHIPTGELQMMSTPTDKMIWSIWGFSEDDMYVCGVGGVVMHFDGTAWTRMDPPTDKTLYSVWGISPSNLYVVGEDGEAYRWNGSDWETLLTGTEATLLTVWGSGANTIYMCGQTSLLHDGANGFEYIEITPLHDFHDVWAFTSGISLAVGEEGTMLLQSGNWVEIDTDTDQPLYGCWWSPGSPISYAVGDDGTVFKNEYVVQTDDDTLVLTDISPPTGYNFRAVWGFDDTTVTVVGEDGQVFHYDGTGWTDETVGTRYLNDVWGINDSVLVVVGDNDEIHIRTGIWTAQPTGLVANWNSVWGFAADDFYVVGDNGVIAHYDGGLWSTMPSMTATDLTGIWGQSSTELYAVGDDGIILEYNGTAWSVVEDPPVAANLSSIHGYASGLAVAAGEYSILLQLSP